MFPTEMFATRTQRKICRVLAEKNRRYTIAELSDLCYRSEPTVSRALRDSSVYPFIERGRVSGSKAHTYGLDDDSEYSEPIRDLFRIERRKERKNGTVPVDVWNLLEDATLALRNGLEEFVELYLFGSYATGEYYAGSDIDLVLAASDDGDRVPQQARDIVDDKIPEEHQLFVVPVGAPSSTAVPDGGSVTEAVRQRGPVGSADGLIPLYGRGRA